MKAGDRVQVAPNVEEVGGRIGIVARVFKDNGAPQRAMVRFYMHRVIRVADLTVAAKTEPQ